MYKHNFKGLKVYNRNIEGVSRIQYDAYKADLWLMSPPCQVDLYDYCYYYFDDDSMRRSRTLAMGSSRALKIREAEAFCS